MEKSVWLVLFGAVLGNADRELGQALGPATEMIKGLGGHLCVAKLKNGFT